MPLHLDKRPSSLDMFLGNEGIKDSLKSVLSRKQDIPHVFLFKGPKGCGKTTLGRIVASMVGCHPTSIQEINCATNNGIDTIRAIEENAQYGGLYGKNKMYILDEAHCLTSGKQGAQNSLLKITEEPPSHVFFVLCTTEPNQLLPTLVSRCMPFEVKPLATPILTKLIKETVKSEGIDDFPDSVVNAIVKSADGCPRQALIILDSVIDIVDEEAALKAVAEANLSETSSLDLCRLLISDTKNKWPDARELLKGLPDDAEGIRYGIMGYMQKIILNEKSGNEITERAVLINDCFMESLMYTKMPGLINAVYYACKV